MRYLIMVILAIFLSGCINPKTDSLLVGAGIGAGITCMVVKGDPFCWGKDDLKKRLNGGSAARGESQLDHHSLDFPDASIPYNMY
ncbi:MAG: hypothetical protein ACTTJS_02615 [Wolinella sp.]